MSMEVNKKVIMTNVTATKIINQNADSVSKANPNGSTFRTWLLSYGKISLA